MARPLLHQILDIAIAGLIAGFTTLSLSVALPRLSVSVGVLLAAAYYFSRYPWGGDGERFNDQIDALYDRLLER
jgi:hypothetical protein